MAWTRTECTPTAKSSVKYALELLSGVAVLWNRSIDVSKSWRLYYYSILLSKFWVNLKWIFRIPHRIPLLKGQMSAIDLGKWVVGVPSLSRYAKDQTQKNAMQLDSLTLRKKCPYSELFWSVFSRTRTEEYSVSLRIQSESGEIRTRLTSNTDTFHAFWF